jgi:hypothetical protein
MPCFGKPSVQHEPYGDRSSGGGEQGDEAAVREIGAGHAAILASRIPPRSSYSLVTMGSNVRVPTERFALR